MKPLCIQVMRARREHTCLLVKPWSWGARCKKRLRVSKGLQMWPRFTRQWWRTQPWSVQSTVAETPGEKSFTFFECEWSCWHAWTLTHTCIYTPPPTSADTLIPFNITGTAGWKERGSYCGPDHVWVVCLVERIGDNTQLCVCEAGRQWRPPAFQFPESQTQLCMGTFHHLGLPSRFRQVCWQLTTGARKSLHQKMWDRLCVCTIMSTICHIKKCRRGGCWRISWTWQGVQNGLEEWGRERKDRKVNRVGIWKVLIEWKINAQTHIGLTARDLVAIVIFSVLFTSS